MELGAHLTYQAFLNAVEELVEYWGPDTPREGLRSESGLMGSLLPL